MVAVAKTAAVEHHPLVQRRHFAAARLRQNDLDMTRQTPMTNHTRFALLSLLVASMASSCAPPEDAPLLDDSALPADDTISSPSFSAAGAGSDTATGRTTASLPPGSPDGEGNASPPAHEGPLQGTATPPPNGPDGETPYQDPLNPDVPSSPPATPDLSPAQVLRLTQLSASSGRPFAARMDDTFAVPASLRGAWTRPESAPSAAALAFVATLNTLYGVDTRTDTLVVASVNERLFTNIKLQQNYRGVPVFGAELIVHTRPVAPGGTQVRFI